MSHKKNKWSYCADYESGKAEINSRALCTDCGCTPAPRVRLGLPYCRSCYEIKYTAHKWSYLFPEMSEMSEMYKSTNGSHFILNKTIDS